MKPVERIEYYDLPTHKITMQVVGVGGTGSHVLNNLARMHKTLKMLGHPGISVIAYDPDEIEEHNIGRQLFYPPDIGKNKASVLISRINRSYGLDWEARSEFFMLSDVFTNIIITCVDTVRLRMELSIFSKPPQHTYARTVLKDNHYWLDIGNERMKGQIYLDDYGENFKRMTEVFPMITDKPIEEESKGCVIIDSLNAQELFINEFMANLAVDFIYRILRNKEIEYNAIFADLENYNIQTAQYLTMKE